MSQPFAHSHNTTDVHTGGLYSLVLSDISYRWQMNQALQLAGLVVAVALAPLWGLEKYENVIQQCHVYWHNLRSPIFV